MHQCPLCPKSFPSPYKLQRHYVIHTGQKPFICKVCGKAFTQSDHLKTHLQKVNHSRFPTDCPGDGILTHNQQASCDKTAAGIKARGSSNYSSVPPTVSSSVVCQPEWKMEIVTHKMFLRSSKTGNPQKNMPHVNDGSVTQNSISHAVDTVPQKQVNSANEDTSVCNAHSGYTCKVCLKSFTSSLQLWIHSPTHKKTKQFEKSRETFSKNAHSKVHLQSRELISSTSKMTLQHQCPKCLKTFCSPSKLQRHFLIHTGQKPYSCMICWKAFRQKIHLKSHLSAANKCSLSAGTERKKQRFCDVRQTSGLQPQSSLQQQAINHCTSVNSSVELELQCKISANTEQDLNTTEIKSDAVVKPEQPFNTSSQCQSICHKSDEQEQQHLTQKDLKSFQCMICNRSFRLEVNLIRHHEIHRNQKELASPTTVLHSKKVTMSDSEAIKHLPEPSYADPIDLNIIVKPDMWRDKSSDHHNSPQDSELITSAEQQKETCCNTSKQQRISTLHQCHACLKCFPSLSKLQRHILTHTGQRPFGCEVCGKRFRQKTHLRVHCRTHLWSRYHKQRSVYINRPPSCIGARTAADVPVQETLMRKKNFETHTGSDVVSVKHLDQTPSMIIITNDNRDLDKNLLPHTSKKKEVVHMRMTPRVTVKRIQTAKSMQNRCNIQHRCSQCLKCFPSASKLQRHEMVHTGVKPFSCRICGKAFRQAPHLKNHERTHCERKPSKPDNKQENIRKLNSQQQFNPRISVQYSPQKKSSNFDGAVCDGVSELLCARREISITKVNSLVKTNSKSNVSWKKKKSHTCRICFKSFVSPYKLSRHLVTHSGIRPYKCTLCSKTFTQRGHLMLHEHRCRQGNWVQDKCIKNLIDCTYANVDATREQPESHYTRVGHYSFIDGDLSYSSEPIDTEWPAVPEVGLHVDNNELEPDQKENCYQTADNCNQATDSYDQATDHCSYSFPSELAFEINKLVQNQNIAATPLSHQYEGNTHNVEVPCQPNGTTGISDSNKLLSDKLELSSVFENEMQLDNYWCEPITVFECDMCTASFKSNNDLKEHICSTNIQSKMTGSVQKHRCNVCLKYFVTPSKLKRHYLIHTGQRPFRCDICGKTFTQSAHVRTHRLTH